jgi:hypothetical protein
MEMDIALPTSSADTALLIRMFSLPGVLVPNLRADVLRFVDLAVASLRQKSRLEAATASEYITAGTRRRCRLVRVGWVASNGTENLVLPVLRYPTQAILLRHHSESLKKPFIVARSPGMDCGSFLPGVTHGQTG